MARARKVETLVLVVLGACLLACLTVPVFGQAPSTRDSESERSGGCASIREGGGQAAHGLSEILGEAAKATGNPLLAGASTALLALAGALGYDSKKQRGTAHKANVALDAVIEGVYEAKEELIRSNPAIAPEHTKRIVRDKIEAKTTHLGVKAFVDDHAAAVKTKMANGNGGAPKPA